MFERHDGRSLLELRPLATQFTIYPQALGSVLISLGQTRVLCSVTHGTGVPSFLRGSKTGWLTAEYAMLPAATTERTSREVSSCKRNGRVVEISRMIGRCLRTCVNLQALGESTLHIDCDVLNADAGTRVAALIGAQLALLAAEKKLLETGAITAPLCRQKLAAVSVGCIGENILIDPCYLEDIKVDVDFNFVMTHDGDVIEVQGSAEKRPISWQLFQKMATSAHAAITQIASFMNTIEL